MKESLFSRIMYWKLFFVAALLWVFIQTGIADTFKHKTSGQIYHGYAFHDAVDGKTTVVTSENGKQELNLTEYTVTLDRQGRNPFVSVFRFEGPIEHELVTSAFEKAVIEESNKGPQAIVLEIDSPGGRIDLATRICTALTKTRNCTTVAFVKGDKQGGAYSAAAAISIACNKIYMCNATVIGAATAVDGRGADLEKTIGANYSEKIRSAWRNYMASLAEENKRPMVMARAMENKDIEIIQVRRDNKTLYIDRTEKMASDELIRVKKPKGQILTLPAGEAVECGMADKVVSSIQDVLADLNCPSAEVVHTDYLDKAQQEQDKVNRKFEQLKNNLDTKLKTLQAKSKNGGMTIVEAKKSFRALIQEFKYLLKLKQNYPDVPCDEDNIQAIINSIQAELDSM